MQSGNSIYLDIGLKIQVTASEETYDGFCRKCIFYYYNLLFLQQLKKLDKMIENKLIEREQWNSIALGTTSHSDGERVQSSGSQQKMADAIGRYIDIESEIDRCIDKLIATKQDVINVIEQLNTTEYDLLHVVYVQYLTLEDFAEQYDADVIKPRNKLAHSKLFYGECMRKLHITKKRQKL